MAEAPTRVLIVDDSALYRQTISNVLRDAADVAVVGIAKDGLDVFNACRLGPLHEELEHFFLDIDADRPAFGADHFRHF